MPRSPDQILTVEQMRAAEQALIDAGTSVDQLMQTAGRGAAEWVWRLAAHRQVTVLCGPGNNGGDGYVIAEALREKGGRVQVIAAIEPKTEAARNARGLYRGEVLGPDDEVHGEILVDCLFGSGLTRGLSDGHLALLQRLAASHRQRIAIDLPSGVESDSGRALSEGLPGYDLTVALGAWKFAHFLMPACAKMGALKLVGIGVEPVAGAASAISAPALRPPASNSHKYKRGLLGVVAGEMPGAALLAATAAQQAGAGYVKLFGHAGATPPDLVSSDAPLRELVDDPRIAALLVGPGLGRDDTALDRLTLTLSAGKPNVLDADALILLEPKLLERHSGDLIATPHEGELAMLERVFSLSGEHSKPGRALALARASGMVVVAKGPDTVIAASDGRLALSQRGSSWLSVAGTGDVLAGAIASRLATGADPFDAACQGVWLHGEAARLAPHPFTAAELARTIGSAYAACL